MIPHLVLLAAFAIFWWLIKRDTAARKGTSCATWVPTLWVGIIASRNLSAWLGFGGATDSLEGSPLDRLFFFGMIIAAFVVLSRRRLIWSSIIADNWAIFLFYGFLLLSVLWAEHPFVSFKRWFKEFGNILVVLIILTEEDPLEAFRAVFMRCAYVLLPLSVVFIRYFPDLGRYYSLHSGQMEAVGVTCQ
jgi:exopolysaccharide production protein ExoQ